VRALFLGSILVFLVAPSYVLQWIALFLAAAIVLAWLYSTTVSAGLSVERRRTEITAFRHEAEEVELVLENRTVLPLPFVSVSDKLGNLYSPDEHDAVLSFFPRERRVHRYRIKGHQRGRYRIGPVRVRTADPFGFFRVDREFADVAHVLIYPRIRRSLIGHSHGVPAGKLHVTNPIYEDLTRYRSVRPYVPGDDTRRINWKATARAGALQTMEYLPALDVPIVILLNLCAADYVQRHRYHAGERAVEVAASLAAHAAEVRQSLSLVAVATLDVDADPEPGGGRPGGTSRAGAGQAGPGSAARAGAGQAGPGSAARAGAAQGGTAQGGADGRHPIILPLGPAHGRVAQMLAVLADVQLNSSRGARSLQLLEEAPLPYRADVYYVGPVPPGQLRSALQTLSDSGRRVECFYLAERDSSRPPERETGMRVHIIPEYGDWDVA
jgi:hypothetical protein